MKGELDESDRFLMDPSGFASELARNWPEPPSHIVMFASEETKLGDFMIQHSFKEASFKLEHSFFCFPSLTSFVLLCIFMA